jgi:hypothetical protein
LILLNVKRGQVEITTSKSKEGNIVVAKFSSPTNKANTDTVMSLSAKERKKD